MNVLKHAIEYEKESWILYKLFKFILSQRDFDCASRLISAF